MARIPASIPDGTSNTIAFTEKRMQCPMNNGSQFFWGETNGWCDRGPGGTLAAFYTLSVPQFNPPPNSCNPCMPNSSTTAGM